MRRALLVFAGFIWSLALQAAEPLWHKVSTGNFELYTTAGPKKGIEAVQHFEQIRSFFRQAARNARGRTEHRVRLVAFRGEKEYKPYRPNDSAVAYYASRGDQDYIVMREIGPDVFRTAVHEYVHLLLRQPGAELPNWLNEGLAELYSTLAPQGSKARVGEIIPGHFQLLHQSKWLPLAALITVDSKSPYYNERERAGVFYAESWALTHMLNFEEAYRPRFDAFLNQMARGVSTQEAFRSEFSKSPEEIEKDLRAYLQGTRFHAGLVNVKLEKSAEAPEAEAAPEVELGLTLADVLGSRHPEAARESLEKLAAAHPKNAEVAEALGYLAWREGRREQALEQFERAVSLGSRNAKMHYECAGLAWEQERPPARQLEYLRKAVELNPQYREAWLRLGYLSFNQRQFAETVEALGQIKRVSKEEAPEFFRVLAFAHFELGDKEAARKNAELARQHAGTAQQMAAASDLLRFLTAQNQNLVLAPATAPAEPPSAAPPFEPRPQGPALYPAAGLFVQLDCKGTQARMHLQSGEKQMVFLIDVPDRIKIRGAQSDTLDFTCGPQKPRQVTIEYALDGALPPGVTGLLRTIEWQ